ncbi:MAG TPA: hypothetical protein DD620_02760 [Verrucomicrobia bacterium]|nr:hypothetical protein [Verrucomicrobiota bacterium]
MGFLNLLPLLSSGIAHTFTATDGRTLEATIIRYQPDQEQVEIKRADGTLLRVKSTLFEPADQTYIQQWYAAQQFGSSHFRMQIKEVEGPYRKQTHSVDFGEERRGLPGAGFGNVEIANDKKTPVNYQLTLHNKASVPIEKVKIEYKIFYQQEAAVEMEVPEERQTERTNLLVPHRPQNQLKIKEGRFKTLSLEAGETWEDDSPMITLLERKTLRRFQQYINLDSEPMGIWVRCSHRDPNGTVIVRDFIEPAQLEQDVSWDQEETIEPRPRPEN